jgi:hypothetical protein
MPPPSRFTVGCALLRLPLVVRHAAPRHFAPHELLRIPPKTNESCALAASIQRSRAAVLA